MDPREFQRLAQQAKASQPTQQPTPEVTGSEDTGILEQIGNAVFGETPEAPAPEVLNPPEGQSLDQSLTSGLDAALAQTSGPQRAIASAVSGGLKAVFETSDFLFGDTKPGDMSNARSAVEDANKDLTDGSIVNGFASGVGQFATAMFGLGKISKTAQAIGWVGKGAQAVEATKKGKLALETGKAALAGFVSVDPHADRLSNLVQGTPLANPVSNWLAAAPDDSAAEGRVKNALESIGMDVAIIGTLTAAGKVFKYLKSGDTAGAGRSVDDFQAEQRAQLEQADAAELTDTPGAGASPEVPPQGDVPPSAGQRDALPAGDPVTGNALVNGEVADANYQRVGPEAGGGSPELLPNSNADGPLPDAGSTPPTNSAPEASTPRAPDPEAPTSGPGSAETNGAEQRGDATGGEGVPTPEPQVDLNGNLVEADGRRLPRVRPSQMVKYADEDTAKVFANAKSDIEAIQQYGGRYQAAEAGHKFSTEDSIPYDKLSSDGDVDAFAQRAVEAKLEEMDKLKGGDVVSDADVQATVMGLAKLTGEDPAKLLGRIQQSGAQARQMAADMEVGFVVGNKMLDDAWALNERMLMGDFTEFGTKQAMQDEVTKRLTLAASFLSPARSIASNSGRSLRRMRRDVQWIDPKYIKEADPETLSQLLRSSGGNPANMRTLLNPSFWGKATDFITAMRINSLVSGYLTQFYNVVSSGYMVGVRPMQRIIGATVTGDIRAVDKNLRQYVYMGNALMEGWHTAVKAFTDEGIRAGFKAAGDTSVGAAVKSFGRNDSVIRPHSTEALNSQATAPGMGQIGPSQLRPIKGMGDLFYNIFSVAGSGLTVPGRALGATDELFKQITYRSKLMADAHVEAVMAASGKNLQGRDLKDFMRSYMDNRMAGAFDQSGRGLDANALREANIATFQQDLAPGTLGKAVQTFASNWPAARWVLPFIKTPTNVIRESWRLTPVLNVAQGEYRQMLMGKMGAEAQQQAMGQMAMGTAFMGAAAFLSSTGRITGGGPSDTKMARELRATGWRPYSFVVQKDDGSKVYVPFNRVDPIATPFGIIADIQDAIHHADWDGTEGTASDIETAIGALRIGLSKQFTQKSYLMGLTQFMDALMDADDNDKWLAAGGGILQSLVPYSALSRQTNDDVYMREARSVADKMRTVIPGQSESLPAQYDWLGEPILARPGLWTSDNGSLVDGEVQRIAQETDKVPFQRVNPNQNGVDLRELTLSDGRNAYEVYSQLSGKPTKSTRPLRDVIAELMQRKAYLKAPDGGADIKGTKAWLLAKRVSKYRTAALKVLKRDPKVREAFLTPEQKVRDFYKNLRATPEQQSKAPSLGGIIQAYTPGN